MTEVIASLRVRPLYAQVSVESENALEVPVRETGKEAVVATKDSLMVATRPDQDGDVQIDVYQGQVRDGLGERVFAGELTTSTPFLVVGNTIANRLLRVPIGRTGTIPIEIYVDNPKAPSHVNVVVF